MVNRQTIFFFLFCFGFFFQVGAQHKIDSLKKELAGTRSDRERAGLLMTLAETADEGEWEKFNDELYILSSKKIAEPDCIDKSEWEKFYANSCINKGLIEQREGRNEKAVSLYHTGFLIHQRNGNQEGIANAANNLGLVFHTMGNIPEALEYLGIARKVNARLNNKFGEAHILINLSYISALTEDTLKALEYAAESAKLRIEIGDSLGLAQSYSNIGVLHDHSGRYDKALEYYRKSLKIRLLNGDKTGLAVCYNNIGTFYIKNSNVQEGLLYFNKAAKLAEETGSTEELCIAFINISKALLLHNKVQKSLEYANKASKLAEVRGVLEYRMDVAELLYKIYKKSGNTEKSFKLYKQYITMRDSINNENSRKSVLSNQFKYEFEKKAVADSVKNAEAQNVKEAQLKAQGAKLTQEKNQRYVLLSGLVLVLSGLGFVINRYRLTQKQKKVIESQKLMVDHAYESLAEKNKEVMDSIHYAKRIQTAIVTNEKYIDKQLRRLQK